MLFAISIIITILGLVFYKSKGIFYLTFFWQWILLGFCSDLTRFDYSNYLNNYNNLAGRGLSDYTGTEPGYFILTKCFHNMGFSYDTVYKIFVFFILAAVAYVIKKNTKRICIPMVLFLWYPAIMSAYNTREGIAMAISIIAIQILIEDKKYSLIKYIVLILLAGSIHTSVLFYLLFILIKFQNNISKKKLVVIVLLGVIAMLAIDNISIIQSLIGERRFNYYFTRSHVTTGTIVASIIWQISICIIIYILKKVKINNKYQISFQNDCPGLQVPYYDYVEKICLLLLVLCPLYASTFTYIRLTRNLLIYVYVYFARWCDVKENSIKAPKKAIFSLWSLFTIYGLNVLVSNDFEDVISVFYTYNDFGHVYWNYPVGVCFFGFLIIVGFALDAARYKRTTIDKSQRG